MPVNQILLLLLVGGGLTLFVLSNLSPPVLPLMFLGMQTPALPLTVWMGIAIAAGVITSLVLQLLSYLQRGYQGNEDVAEIPPRNRWASRTASETRQPEPPTPDTPSPPHTKTQTPSSDWEETSGEDWNFEEEPVGSQSDQDYIKSERPSPSTSGNRSSYEVKQEPSSTSQSGSVYSYSYRESSRSGVGKTDGIYDANYRVIMPPYHKSTQPVKEDEDEDWGFEDDEDFDTPDR